MNGGRVAAVLLGVLLAACATRWVKPGASQADFDHDAAECSEKASVLHVISDEDQFWACMEARGYRAK